MFESIDEVGEKLTAQGYVSDKRLATVVFLATRLHKPVLVEGPAGVGKTELANSLAGATAQPLIRLQCYEGLDEAKALYEWEYSKQLLYTQVLREKIGQSLAPTENLREAAEVLRGQEDIFFSENFLVERLILKAIRSEGSAVLLIDEIDRADEEFEAFLLEFLSDYQVSIPEIGTLKADRPPVVVLTSNRTRELSEALKRRCLHLQLDYPNSDVELQIVRLKAPGISEVLSEELVRTIQDLRTLDLRKAPSIGETLHMRLRRSRNMFNPGSLAPRPAARSYRWTFPPWISRIRRPPAQAGGRRDRHRRDGSPVANHPQGAAGTNTANTGPRGTPRKGCGQRRYGHPWSGACQDAQFL